MIYPGDTHQIVFSLSHANGTTPSVTTAPLVTVINLTTGAAVVTAAAMTLVAGTCLVYSYAWNTAGMLNGDYLAVVSYAADGITVNGQYLDQIRLGDTNIPGPVALNATVALDATVAKDATVAHLTDLATINPNTSSVILAIQAKTANLPAIPAAQSDVTALVQFLTDIHDTVLGTWIVDKTQNPKVLSFLRLDGSNLATFTVTEDDNSAARTVSA